jgi:hypothetical protein
MYMINVSDGLCRGNEAHVVLNSLIQNSFRLRDNVEKYCIARQDIDDNIILRMCFSCPVSNGRIHTRTQNV